MTSLTFLSAVLAVGAVAVVAVPVTRRRTSGLLLAGVTAISLLATGAVVATDHIDVRSPPGIATQVEVLGLLVLVVLSARWAPIKHLVAAVPLAGVAVGLIVTRFPYGSDHGAMVVGIAAWAIAVLGAASVGLHLRSLDERRAKSVVEAQRAQRVHLARDLHDFVAHDVSEMLAQAQAGQILAAGHPQSADTFAKIEEAALRALRSMDQTVQMLHVTSEPRKAGVDANSAGPPTLEGLTSLVARFSDANGLASEVTFDGIDEDALPSLPSVASGTLYRVAVEALTNIRRHAATTTTVMVALRRTRAADGVAIIELTVTDDATRGEPTSTIGLSRRHGLGLSALRELVEGIGGSFEAGPLAPRGWRVVAAVPLEDGSA